MKYNIKVLVTSVIVILSIVIPSSALSFKDLAYKHWAYRNITKLSELGVINGYKDGSFRPHGVISRAEFAKLLSTVYISGKEVDFADGRNFINKTYGSGFSSWSKKYLFMLSLYDILKVSDDKLDMKSYNGQITRGEMAVMIARAIGKKNAPASSFSDRGYFGNKVSAIDGVYAAGIINGYPDGTFKAYNSATRAEASKIIANYISYMGLQPEDILFNMEFLDRLSPVY